MRLLAFLGGHGPKVLFVGVFIGLVLPDLAALARPLVGPAVATLLVLTLLRVEWSQMAVYLRRPGLLALLVVWLMLVSPVATWGVMAFLPGPQPLEVALVLMAAAPPILGVTAIAILLGLDGALALVMALAATLLTPITVPLLSLWLLGLELEVSIAGFMARLALVVLGAFVLALVLRRLAGVGWFRARAVSLDGLVVLVMLVFAIAIMEGVTATIFTRPDVVALWIFAAFVAKSLAAGRCGPCVLVARAAPSSDRWSDVRQLQHGVAAGRAAAAGRLRRCAVLRFSTIADVHVALRFDATLPKVASES